MAPRESLQPRQRERVRMHPRDKGRSHSHTPRKSRGTATSSKSSSQVLSADSLAKLNLLNQQAARQQEVTPKKAQRKRQREIIDEKPVIERNRKQHKSKKERAVSGALLEEGDSQRLRGLRGGDWYASEYSDGKRKKRLCT